MTGFDCVVLEPLEEAHLSLGVRLGGVLCMDLAVETIDDAKPPTYV